MPNPSPARSTGDSLVAIHAPYNFVPLSRCILAPDWAERVSLDLPFRDGVSGVLEFTLTAHTPLLVGGAQGKEGRTRVDFFRTPDGQYAIPGASLRGMIRNVVEIAAFGKMRLVDDRPIGLRDISGQYVKAVYSQAILRTPTRAGYLRRRADGGAEVLPCTTTHAPNGFVRISHRDLEAHLQWRGPEPLFKKRTSVQQKHEQWGRLARPLYRGGDTTRINFDIQYPKDPRNPTQFPLAINLGKGKMAGQLVFTGQISDRTDDHGKTKGKYLDFVFFDAAPVQLPLEDKVWRGFRIIHGEGGKDQAQGPWLGHWKKSFDKGEKVPVFYHQDAQGRISSLGLAYMYKLLCDQTIHSLMDNTNGAHRQAADPDLAELLFGSIGAEGERHADTSLKGRVSFGLARWQTGVAALPPGVNTILNGPKPSYFPNYLCQAGDASGERLRGSTYSTYMDPQAELRGWKRYPVRPTPKIQPLTEEQLKNPKVQVQVTLRPLPEGIQFRGCVHLHNLRPVEVGAVLWAMTWGGEPRYRHALGLGKPFGLGQVQLQLDQGLDEPLPLIPNREGEQAGSASHYMGEFLAWVDAAYRAEQQGDTAQAWRQSNQITQLLAMADPAQGSGHTLEHMRLSTQPRINDFVEAKQKGMILKPYADFAGQSDRDLFAKPSQDPTPGGTKQSKWLTDKVKELAGNNPPQEQLRGKRLAEAIRDIADPSSQRRVLQEVVAIWEEEGWWQIAKPSGSMKAAKEIYQRLLQNPAI